jgi:hypothetical protein
MIRKLSFCAGVFVAVLSAVVLGDPGGGGSVSVCDGTCDGSNAIITWQQGVTACDQAQTSYTCTVPVGVTSYTCPGCIHNENDGTKCRCLIGN